MKPTLGEARRLLETVNEKKITGKRLQDLFASGLLSDLLEADPSTVDRSEFRKFLGLGLEILSRFTLEVLAVDPLGVPEGWEILEDVTDPTGMLTLEPVEFLKPGETIVKGEVMVQRAKELGANLGLRHAMACCKNQGRILVEYRRFFWTFPRTICRGPDGNRRVPCLFWLGGEWMLYWLCLEDDWYAFDRLLRSCA